MAGQVWSFVQLYVCKYGAAMQHYFILWYLAVNLQTIPRNSVLHVLLYPVIMLLKLGLECSYIIADGQLECSHVNVTSKGKLVTINVC